VRKITPLTFQFIYIETPTGQARVKNAYRKIFERAKQNILRQKDTLNGDMSILDSTSEKVQTDHDGTRRIINDPGNSSEIKAFQGNDLPNDKTGINSSSKGGIEMADKQPILNKFIRTSQ